MIPNCLIMDKVDRDNPSLGSFHNLRDSFGFIWYNIYMELSSGIAEGI